MRVSAIIAVVELAIMMTFAVLPLDTGPYTRAFLDAAPHAVLTNAPGP